MDRNRIEISNEKRQNKKKAIILVLGILTILVALMGASFAYISTKVRYPNGQESFKISTRDIEGVTFQASDSISLYDAIPGDSSNMNFTISNPNESARVRYTLKLVADENDFNVEDGYEQLLITLSGRSLEEPIVVDFTDGENMKSSILASNIELSPSASDVYNLELKFAELNESQNSNQRKNFVGHIEVTQTLVIDSQN